MVIEVQLSGASKLVIDGICFLNTIPFISITRVIISKSLNKLRNEGFTDNYPSYRNERYCIEKAYAIYFQFRRYGRYYDIVLLLLSDPIILCQRALLASPAYFYLTQVLQLVTHRFTPLNK